MAKGASFPVGIYGSFRLIQVHFEERKDPRQGRSALSHSLLETNVSPWVADVYVFISVFPTNTHIQLKSQPS